MPDDHAALLLPPDKAPDDPRVKGMTTTELDALARKFWAADEFTPGGIPVTWKLLRPDEQTKALKLHQRPAPPVTVQAAIADHTTENASPPAAGKIFVTLDMLHQVLEPLIHTVRDFVNEKIDKRLAGQPPAAPAAAADKAPEPAPTPADHALVDAIEDYVERACMPLAKKIVELERKLEGVPHDGGLWERGKRYRRGAMVTHSGSMFIAQCDTDAAIGGTPPSADWRMCVQRGRDAR